MGLVCRRQVVGRVQEDQHVARAQRYAGQNGNDRRVRRRRGDGKEELADGQESAAAEEDQQCGIDGTGCLAAEALREAPHCWFCGDGETAAQADREEWQVWLWSVR